MDTASRSLVLTEEWLSASKDSELDESQHSWEAPLAFTWSSVLQDQDGQLISDTKDKQRESRRIRMVKEKDALKAAKVERGMVRFLVLVVDMSTAMEMKDLKPSRKLLACEAIEKFVAEFFDQNPISKLGIVVAKNRRATRLTELSGNPKQQVELLRNAMEEHASGEFSLQNALQTAKKSLEQMPDYGSREMILVTGSLTSCDPGDIFQTFQEVKSSRIQCSFISLSAEVYVFKALAELTKGSFAVVFNEKHLDALLAERVPPSLTDMELHRNRVRRWIHMGFPKMISETYPSLCAWYLSLFSFT